MADIVMLPNKGAFVRVVTASNKYLVPTMYETEHAANVPATFRAISSNSPGQLYLVWTPQFGKTPGLWPNTRRYFTGPDGISHPPNLCSQT